MKRLLILLFAIFSLGCPAADRSVGAACRDDFDCRDRCLEDWPGGFCTLRCDGDRDCPPDTVCTDTRGGVCLLLCDDNRHCRTMLDDSDYVCRERDNIGRGDDFVCVPD